MSSITHNQRFSINYDYVRPRKAKLLKEWHEERCFASDEPLRYRAELSVSDYKNAVILPLRKVEGSSLLFGLGGVIDESGIYVDSSGLEGRLYGAYEAFDAQSLHETVVYCGYLVNHWGHFLVEAVSRLWYWLENMDSNIDHYVFFIEEGQQRELSGNYKEFLSLLGVEDKIQIINAPTRYDRVIIPELSYKWRDYYSDQYRSIYQSVIQKALRKKDNDKIDSNKIFLTRSALPSATVLDIGGEMLDEWFSKNGFQIISPEKISLSVLIKAINKAEIVAAISGTLPHNFLFAQSGKKTLIVERDPMINEIQCDVNIIKALDVTYVDGNLFLYPINGSIGPYLLYYNSYLSEYADDNNMCPPDSKYLSERWKKKLYNKYMDAYIINYRRGWYFPEWFAGEVLIMREAYVDSLKILEDYVEGEKGKRIFDRMLSVLLKGKVKGLIKRSKTLMRKR